MGNPAVPVHGETIESSWGADVVSRLVPVYPDAAARDAALPAPVVGQLAAVANDAHLFTDDGWIPVVLRQRDQTVTGTDPNAGTVTIDAAGVTLAVGSTRLVEVRYNRVNILAADDASIGLQVEHRGFVKIPYTASQGTHGSAVPIGVLPDGSIFKVASSERYKTDITPWTPSQNMTVPLTRWRSAIEVDEMGDDAPYVVGPTAEAVDAAGLVDFVIYDDQGRPDAIHAAELALAYAAALEARLAALEARLAALEGP